MAKYSVNPNGKLWVHDRWFDEETEYEQARKYDEEFSFRRLDEHPRLFDMFNGWLPFEEAREYVWPLGFLNSVEWDEHIRGPMYRKLPRNLPELPSNIPHYPEMIYEDEWQGWPDWLGYEEAMEWRDFEEARDYVHTLGLPNYLQWWEWAVSEARPRDIPFRPEWEYKEDGFFDLQDWLVGYRSYEEAREYVRSLGLRTANEWREYCKSGQKPDDIPRDPKRYYGDKWGRK